MLDFKTILLGPLASTALASVDLPFEDNFDSSNLDGWNTAGDGAWEVQDGQLSGNSSTGNTVALVDTKASDFTFNATVTPTDFSGGSTGLIFRASDLDGTGSFYWYKIWAGGHEIGISEDGVDSTLASKRSSHSNEEYRIDVTAKGNKVTVVQNESYESGLLEFEDDKLTGGAMGVAVFGGPAGALFDEVLVTAA